jgi:hypothetical protein
MTVGPLALDNGSRRQRTESRRVLLPTHARRLAVRRTAHSALFPAVILPFHHASRKRCRAMCHGPDGSRHGVREVSDDRNIRAIARSVDASTVDTSRWVVAIAVIWRALQIAKDYGPVPIGVG